MTLLLTLAMSAAAQDLVVTGATTVSVDTTYEDIRVQPGGVLTISGAGPITLTARSVYVAPGGLITATGTGYGPSAVAGLGPSGGSVVGAGGGGAGDGRPSRALACEPGAPGGVGIPPANADDIDMGSSGGGATGLSSAGGGALTLVADDIEIYGDITADGLPATADGGAGGGGSIVLRADRLVCAGQLSARGGEGVVHGPGGGGAIFQHWDSAGSACDSDVRGGDESECDTPGGGVGRAVQLPVDYDLDLASNDCFPRDPNLPAAEVCNGLDDDCNGLVDDGVLCDTCERFESTTGATYQLCRTPVDHTAALDTCEALGSYHLVTLNDEVEFTELSAAIPNFWTGLIDQSIDEYRWSTEEDSWYRPWLDFTLCGYAEPDASGECGQVSDAFLCGPALVDEDCALLHDVVCEACEVRTWFLDKDGDGFGEVGEPVEGCYAEALGSVSAVAGDCDDGRADVHPGAYEVCDGVDNDCDGVIDPSGLLFTDADFDLAGNPAEVVSAEDCALISGVPTPSDCGADFVGGPGAFEACDGVDNNCDGRVDEAACAACAYVAHEDHEYQICDSDQWRDTAQTFCGFTGMQLASLQDNAENQHIADVSRSLGLNRLWLGLYLTGTWEWSDGTAVGDLRWATDEPNGDLNPGAVLWTAEGDFATWNDSTITTLKPYVCERACTPVTRFVDDDGDGFGTGLATLVCDGPGWAPNDADCNDADAASHPGAIDVPGNDIDENCSGLLTCYLDQDFDGVGGDLTSFAADCATAGFASVTGDCDDDDAARAPGTVEIAGDGVDQDCNLADRCFEDLDLDGFGTPTIIDGTDLACASPGQSQSTTDCDDSDPAVFPLAPEVTADGVDQSCDDFDECYVDGDGDGFGSVLGPGLPVLGNPCSVGAVAPNDTDCNDGDASIYPGAPELVSNGVDEDCDLFELCWVDGDGDGVGAATAPNADLLCTGLPTAGNDCDDADNQRFPGNTESPADGVDGDCDDMELCFVDADLDGEPAGSLVIAPSYVLSCLNPGASPVPGLDCDDSDAGIFPGAPEVLADGIDQDCNTFDACYPDADRDTYGVDPLDTQTNACLAPGWSARNGDCNDNDGEIHPGAIERPDSVVDQNCDNFELCPFDLDGDGAPSLGQGALGCDAVAEEDIDCNDDDDTIFPGAPEVEIDGIDQDCDGREACRPDEDGDVFGADKGPPVPGNLDDADTFCTVPGTAFIAGDCDDNDDLVNPGVLEQPCNGIDENCTPDDDCPLQTADTGTAPQPTGSTAETAPTAMTAATGLTTPPDTGPTDTDDPTDTGTDGPPSIAKGAEAGAGCGCASASPNATMWLLPLLLWLRRR